MTENKSIKKLRWTFKFIHRTLFRIQKVGIKWTFPNNSEGSLYCTNFVDLVTEKGN